MVLESGSLVDRYTVIGPLGEGGMSVVYKVRHNTLGSLHALKVLTLSSPGLKQRLLLEGQVQASLRHPNIVPVTDVIDVSGVPGLVMEFVEGPDLDAMLRAHPLNFEQIDILARDIIGAVGAAHAKGLIHRDLKPANILLMVIEDRLVPKITDFGLAKVLIDPSSGDRGRTRTGAMMGTPFYMSPEQVRDAKNVGPQTDVFALGAILYEMITRVRAFQGDDVFEVFGAVAHGNYVPVRERVPDTPDRMEAAIRAALQVDPAARCRDCRELLALWNGEPAPEGGSPRSAGPWSGELLRSASGLSSSARSEPPPAVPSASTFNDARAAKALSAPAAQPAASAASMPPRGALALGVLVGGGGAALAGLGLLLVVALVAWIGWTRSMAPEPAGVDPIDTRPPPEPPQPAEPPAPAPAPAPIGGAAPEGDAPVPAPGAERPPSPAPAAPVAPKPSAPPSPPPVSRPEPPPPPAPAGGALPPDLDPATTRPGKREDALLDVYRAQPGATALISRVLKTDPNPDVRVIAGSVLRSRWKDGVDPGGTQTTISWCARSGDPVALRAQCLRTLGDHGDSRAGAVLGEQMGDPVGDVREAASAGCRRWAERFQGQPCGPTGR